MTYCVPLSEIELVRPYTPDGRNYLTWLAEAILDQVLALAWRQTAELMADELRRLDSDETYETAVKRFARTYKG